MIAGFLYLAMAALLIAQAVKNKQWSWPSFGWLMCATLVIGGAAVWGGTALFDRIGRAHLGLALAADVGVIFVGVALITGVAILLARHYFKADPRLQK